MKIDISVKYIYYICIKTPVPLLKNPTLSSQMPCVFFLKISKHLVNRGGLASGRPPAIAQRVGSLAARYHAVLALKAEVLGVFWGEVVLQLEVWVVLQ